MCCSSGAFCCLLTTEAWIQFWGTSCEVLDGHSATGAVLSHSFFHFLLITIIPHHWSIFINLTSPRGDLTRQQITTYMILKLGTSSLVLHLTGYRVMKLLIGQRGCLSNFHIWCFWFLSLCMLLLNK